MLESAALFFLLLFFFFFNVCRCSISGLVDLFRGFYFQCFFGEFLFGDHVICFDDLDVLILT